MPDSPLTLSPAAKQWVATRIIERTLRPWGGLTSEEGWVRMACSVVGHTNASHKWVVGREEAARIAEEYATSGKKLHELR